MPTITSLPRRSPVLRAIDLEIDHIAHFQTWALRLRPFDPGLSRLLDLQVEEMDEHRRTLLGLSATQLPEKVRYRAPSAYGHALGTGHFFVLDPRGAAAILNQARELKEKALHSYRHFALEAPAQSTLGSVFCDLKRSKGAHLRILREAQTGYALQHPC